VSREAGAIHLDLGVNGKFFGFLLFIVLMFVITDVPLAWSEQSFASLAAA